MEIKTKLWTHQQRMVDFALNLFSTGNFAYWLAGCGVGKTLAVLALILGMDARLILVITVKSGIEQVWCDDIEEHTENMIAIPLVKGTSKVKNKLMLSASDIAFNEANDPSLNNSPVVVVVNYETARLLDLHKIQWDLVVADESHRLSAHNSKISLDLATKLEHVPAKLCMTATGWADAPKQVFGQFRFGLPLKRSRGYWGCRLFGYWDDFMNKFTKYYMHDNIKIISDYKNLDGLAKLIKPYVLEIKESDVLDLPKIHHVYRDVIIPPKVRKAYKEMRKEMTTRIERDGEEDVVLAEYGITQAHRLHQLLRGWYVDWNTNETHRIEGKGNNAVLDECIQLLDEIGGKPTVIFTSYKEDVRILQEALGAKGIKTLQVTGDVHEHKEFQAGDADVLIANIQAGSTGIKLYRAQYIIYYGLNPSTSRTNYLQSIKRVHRPRQVNPVTVFHLNVKNSVDQHIQLMLDGKATRDDMIRSTIE